MLEVCPITLKEANAFVEQHHRHHKPVTGHKFSIGCTDGEKIVGIAIVGRPVSRYLDDGWTLEVSLICCKLYLVISKNSLIIFSSRYAFSNVIRTCFTR